jgi:hypothetical protein
MRRAQDAHGEHAGGRGGPAIGAEARLARDFRRRVEPGGATAGAGGSAASPAAAARTASTIFV